MLYYSGNIWCCLIFTIPVSLIYALLKILKAWDFCTQIMIKNRVKSFHTFKHARPRLLRKKLIIKSLTHTYVKSCNRQFKTRVSIVRVESIFINASKHLKKPDQYAKRCIIDTYWKSYKKSHSTLRAKRATFTFWKDKRSLKNAKYDPFWRLFYKQCYQTGQFW